jgi:hypothetical protein
MILRSKTERQDGIGANAFLTDFDAAHIERFFKIRSSLKRNAADTPAQPSEMIVDHLMPWA